MIPNANSPQLLTRLLESVARGVRSTRGLQEALGVDQRTVQYYIQAGVWLGFVEAEGRHRLTTVGLEYVYGGKARRVVYGRAVWATPFVRDLMLGRDETVLPSVEDVAAAISHAEPELAPTTVRRRASSVRSLVAPGLGKRSQKGPAPSPQLELPLPEAAAGAPLVQTIVGGRTHNPDIYRLVYGALLDHGELTLGQIRALLDKLGVPDVPIGGYVEMALARGDARRQAERIAVTAGGVMRRDLQASTTSIVLSDPGYRADLAARRRAAGGDLLAAQGRAADVDRYARWDRRVFGREIGIEELDTALEQVLIDRSLTAFPASSVEPGREAHYEDPFLDVWEQAGLTIALPPSILQVQGGVPAVNRRLRDARMRTDEVALPTVAQRPLTVHGGLIHPGEPLPRSIPDTRSLRLRMLMNAPYPAMVTAVLLRHRQEPAAATVERADGRWVVMRRGRPVDELLACLDGFGASRGWWCSRRAHGGVGSDALLDVMESLGVLIRLSRIVTLDEAFFDQLRDEAEELEVHAHLAPLADAIEIYLERGGEEG